MQIADDLVVILAFMFLTAWLIALPIMGLLYLVGLLT